MLLLMSDCARLPGVRWPDSDIMVVCELVGQLLGGGPSSRH